MERTRNGEFIQPGDWVTYLITRTDTDIYGLVIEVDELIATIEQRPSPGLCKIRYPQINWVYKVTDPKTIQMLNEAKETQGWWPNMRDGDGMKQWGGGR